MAEQQHTTAPTLPHPIIGHPGTPVIMRTETTVPTSMPINPLLDLTVWSPFLVVIIAVAGVMALFTKHVSGKISDFKEVHKGVHDTLDAKITNMEHKLNNERQRVNALETFRNADIERIVKLETNLHNIEKSQERIEHALEKMPLELGNRIDHWASQFAASIRELRDVKPRS